MEKPPPPAVAAAAEKRPVVPQGEIRKCACHWTDCPNLQNRIVRHFANPTSTTTTSNNTKKKHPWAADLMVFKSKPHVQPENLVSMLAVRQSVIHHFKLEANGNPRTDDLYVAPHHFPASLLQGKNGSPTTLITKMEAKNYELFEGHSRLSKECNRVGTIVQQLQLRYHDVSLVVGEELGQMYVQAPVSSHKEVLDFCKGLAASKHLVGAASNDTKEGKPGASKKSSKKQLQPVDRSSQRTKAAADSAAAATKQQQPCAAQLQPQQRVLQAAAASNTRGSKKKTAEEKLSPVAAQSLHRTRAAAASMTKQQGLPQQHVRKAAPASQQASSYSLTTLQLEQQNKSDLWKSLVFDNVSDAWLDVLFPGKYTFESPPPSWRQSVKKLREWRRLGPRQQVELITNETGQIPPPRAAPASQQASSYSLTRLEREKMNKSDLWKSLAFDNVSHAWLDVLFPGKGEFESPPPSWRKSLTKMREWRRLGRSQQRELVEKETGSQIQGGRKRGADLSEIEPKRKAQETNPCAPPSTTISQAAAPSGGGAAILHCITRTAVDKTNAPPSEPAEIEPKAQAPYQNPPTFVTVPCSGITLDYCRQSRVHSESKETVCTGFRHLVAVAMHNLATAISEQSALSWSRGPFPHRGFLVNRKSTGTKEWFLVENPLAEFANQSDDLYSFRKATCLLTLTTKSILPCGEDGSPPFLDRAARAVCEECRKSRSIVERCKSSVQKRAASDGALKRMPIAVLDTPTLLIKRLKVAQADILTYQQVVRKLTKEAAKVEAKEKQEELPGGIKNGRQGDGDDLQEVLDVDTLMASLGYK